jgi:2'-5' RNA ligase
MRLFVAVDLSDEARQAMAAEQKRIAMALRGSAGTVRWVNPESAHLTLVFLGHVKDDRVPAVVDALAADVTVAPFDMVVEGAGAFPVRGAPRVLWVGVTHGAVELIRVQEELAARVTALGIALDDRAFHPHLTLGRWKQSRPRDRDLALDAACAGPIARVPIAAATLYQSRLSPSGAAYTPLARANLRPRA